MSSRVIVGVTVLLATLVLVLPMWWMVDRPFGGATCWVNYSAETYDQAVLLESRLSNDGLDASVSRVKANHPPSLPVVTVNGGFWKTEDSLRNEVLNGLAEVGGGKFDQCNTPSLGD